MFKENMTSAIFSFSPEQVRNDAEVYFMDTGDDVYLYVVSCVQI